jgi:hypothetical protein
MTETAVAAVATVSAEEASGKEESVARDGGSRCGEDSPAG